MPDTAEVRSGPALDQARVHALARVRSLLVELGCTDDEIDRAVADDVLDLLVVDRLVVPADRRLTQAEVSDQTGIPEEVARRFWRALGFHGVDDDDPAFTELDVEAAQLFQGITGTGVIDLEGAVQMARVIGSSMARIAEAEAGPGSVPIGPSTGDSIIDADLFARQAGQSIPAMARLLEYVWRRHLQAATRRAMLQRARGASEGISPVMAVGFADMVGFTMLSQHLEDLELAAVVARFEELAHDTVVALGGRVVKMIGDEVMFVVQSAASAAHIALSLAEAYAGDELLSDVRVSLAYGPVLVQDGDFYGPVVNLASRLVGVAHPGPLRTRSLKDIGRIPMWKLVRAGTIPGADKRRVMRWERLGDVLRDLDDLRDRGEHAVLTRRDGVGGAGVSSDAEETGHPDGTPGADGSAGVVQPQGGDGLGGQDDAALEPVDRTSP